MAPRSQNQTPQNQNNQSGNGQGDYGSNSDYLQKVDHDADMTDIRKRLDALEARVLTRTNMVDTMKDVYENDRNIDPVISKHMSEYVDIKPVVEKTVSEVDRRWLIGRLKSVWGLSLLLPS